MKNMRKIETKREFFGFIPSPPPQVGEVRKNNVVVYPHFFPVPSEGIVNLWQCCRTRIERTLQSNSASNALHPTTQQLRELFRKSRKLRDLVLPVYFKITKNRCGLDTRQKLSTLVADTRLAAINALDEIVLLRWARRA